jgi:multimeric flavodoxin WrbA
MKAADGIILAAPVYYAGVAGTMKAFCDRAFFVAGANGGLFRHKVGGAQVALRRGGGVAAFDQLNHYFTISEMPVASSTYWGAIHGAAAGEALQDAEGLQTSRMMGSMMAWLLQLMEYGREAVPGPERLTKKARTNFIR